MARSGWKLLGDVAELTFPPLEGRLELTTPAKGVGRLRVRGVPLDESGVLGIDFPTKTVGSQPILDRYIRDDTKLVVSYASVQTWPIQTNVIWKASRPHDEAEGVAILDCVISVSTDRLDTCPELAVRSELAQTEIGRLNRTGVFESMGGTAKTVFSPVQGPSCTLFRLAGIRASYAQMVHPADFFEDELVTHHACAAELRHNLFRNSLEKGVILRARIRGVFWSEPGDAAALCNREFHCFESSTPPLSG